MSPTKTHVHHRSAYVGAAAGRRRSRAPDGLCGLRVQAIFRRRRHQPRRPPLAKIRPGRPAPAMGPGTANAPLFHEEKPMSKVAPGAMGFRPLQVKVTRFGSKLAAACPALLLQPGGAAISAAKKIRPAQGFGSGAWFAGAFIRLKVVAQRPRAAGAKGDRWCGRRECVPNCQRKAGDSHPGVIYDKEIATVLQGLGGLVWKQTRDAIGIDLKPLIDRT